VLAIVRRLPEGVTVSWRSVLALPLLLALLLGGLSHLAARLWLGG
jgi:hypothetical protein